MENTLEQLRIKRSAFIVDSLRSDLIDKGHHPVDVQRVEVMLGDSVPIIDSLLQSIDINVVDIFGSLEYAEYCQMVWPDGYNAVEVSDGDAWSFTLLRGSDTVLSFSWVGSDLLLKLRVVVMVNKYINAYHTF